MNSAFAKALRFEMTMVHRDQHKDVAKARRLFGPYYWCTVCGFFPR